MKPTSFASIVGLWLDQTCFKRELAAIDPIGQPKNSAITGRHLFDDQTDLPLTKVNTFTLGILTEQRSDPLRFQTLLSAHHD